MDARRTGQFIADLRKEQDLTQRQLAECLLVSDKAVSRWETGHGMPDIDNLEALSNTLGVSIAELMRGERIVDPVAPAETDAIALSGIELAGALLRKRTVANVVLGFLAGVIVAVLAIVHLTSPIALPFDEGSVRVEALSDGTIAAVSAHGVAGWDIDEDAGVTYISCYTTRWSQLTGSAGTRVAVLGAAEQIRAVLYYPGAPDDVLLYGQIADAGVITLPRLVYNAWLLIGTAASIVGLAAYALVRTRWYARRVLRAALLPACFTASLIAVLWGRFDEVYNATFYLSGICLTALALYAFCLAALARGRIARR